MGNLKVEGHILEDTVYPIITNTFLPRSPQPMSLKRKFMANNFKNQFK